MYCPSPFRIAIITKPLFKVAVLVNPVLQLVLATFSGIAIPYPTMTKFWRSWLYRLNPYAPTLAAMISTELVSVKLYLS